MLSFLFDCSVFEISANVQTINDILFPIVLYLITFWLMYNIFLIDIADDSNLPMTSFEATFGVVKNPKYNCKTTKELFNINGEPLASYHKCECESKSIA